MKNIQILEDDDIVESTDWCRPLHVEAESSASDTFSTTSCYSGAPMNNLKWAPTNHIFGDYWFIQRHRVKDLCKFVKYEFARGDLQQDHILTD